MVFWCSAVIALPAGRAHAALGGDAASVVTDTAEIHGVAHATPLQQYEIQEITNDSGMRVREFLNRDGVVFAVSWSGPVVPDLRALLGASFDSYVEQLSALRTPGYASLAAGGVLRPWWSNPAATCAPIAAAPICRC